MDRMGRQQRTVARMNEGIGRSFTFTLTIEETHQEKNTNNHHRQRSTYTIIRHDGIMYVECGEMLIVVMLVSGGVSGGECRGERGLVPNGQILSNQNCQR